MNVEKLFPRNLTLDDNDDLLLSRNQSSLSRKHLSISKQSSFLTNNESITQTKSIIKTTYKKHTALIKVGIFLLFYAVGIIAMSSLEGWGFIECVYFITVSITTVGYGFFAPTTPSSRLFMIFYLIIGVTMIISFCTDFTRSVLTACHDEIILRLQRYRGFPPPNNKEMSRYRSLLSVALVFMWCFVGTAFYSGNEGWTVLDGLYWTVVTMTTVGYGDFVIVKTSTRVFGIFFIYASVLTFSVALNNIVDEYSAAKQRGQLREKLQSLSTLSFGQKWLNRLLRPGPKVEASPATPLTPDTQRSDTPCGRERFILYALAELGVLSYSRDIIPLAKKFQQLDTDRKGSLNRQDLQKFLDEIEEISQLAAVPDISVEEVSSGCHRTVINPLHEGSMQGPGLRLEPTTTSHVYKINPVQDYPYNDDMLPSPYDHYPSTNIDVNES